MNGLLNVSGETQALILTKTQPFYTLPPAVSNLDVVPKVPDQVFMVLLKVAAPTYTPPFNGSLSGTTRVSRYQKSKTNLDFTEAMTVSGNSYMHVFTWLQTDSHASTSPLSFLQAECPSCHPTNSVKALKASESCGSF